jgi:transposase-like protein
MSRENKELRVLWSERIKTQRASGLPQKAWCNREGISPNTFQGWVSRLGVQTRKKPAGAFVKVVPSNPCTRPPKAEAAESGEIEVTLVKLKLPACYGQHTLCELIAGLTEQ